MFWLGFVFLVAGVSVLSVGLVRPGYYCSTVLFSVPIFPTTVDNFSWYIGVNPPQVLDSYVFPLESLGDTDVDMLLLDINHPEQPQDVFLLHNLWGYDINLSIVDSDRAHLYEFEARRNIDYESHVETQDFVESDILPSELMHHGNAYVKCSANHTLITMEEDIEPMCHELGGSLLNIDERLQTLHVKEVIFSRGNPPIHFIFHNLKVLPMDFIHTPQMYIVSWKKTNRSTLLAVGIPLIVIGMVVIAIAPCLLFLVADQVVSGTWSSPSPGEGEDERTPNVQMETPESESEAFREFMQMTIDD